MCYTLELITPNEAIKPASCAQRERSEQRQGSVQCEAYAPRAGMREHHSCSFCIAMGMEHDPALGVGSNT